ncbi:hypothetical protein QFC22_005539 [Naganishia vaughanmartiniae]|uniref:Uncharacterized protein n=1 Tax=Naganishia vaughanmartiniae TaxID=1424756 RepID=A0ACC2WT96_9TREE|nr:hypothetical protein QFC22_005539 [Naganishia vaughanmartiniae]
MFGQSLVTTLAAFMAATTPILASNLVWYTEPGSNKPAFTDGDKVRGVNLGNWFILENWMEPSLFGTAGLPGTDNDTQVMDEWSFCEILGKTRCAEVLEEHWATWITEDDFKRMADYGLNTVRIPIPYWVYNVTDDEPYITQKQIPYIQQALNWSSMYGLDVMMDLHALPGSQSSYQVHTGHYTQESFHTDSANIDRALDALGKFVDEFTKDEYEGVVKAQVLYYCSWELVNEPWIESYQANNIPWDFLADFMDRAYTTVREHENVIAGKTVSMVIVHDAFQALDNWKYWFTESKGSQWVNYGIDTHLYHAWSPNADLDNYGHVVAACGTADMLAAAQEWIPTFVGEQSLGVGTFCVDYKECFDLTSQDLMANVSAGSSDADYNNFYRALWESQYHAYNHGAGFIFWNWKAISPVWSYEQSVTQRWIPTDLDDTLWAYDSSQEFCLQNYNWSNVPSYPTVAVSPIPLGTSLPTGKALLINATSFPTAAITAVSTGPGIAIPTGMSTVPLSGGKSTTSMTGTGVTSNIPSSTATTSTSGAGAVARLSSHALTIAACLGFFMVLHSS